MENSEKLISILSLILEIDEVDINDDTSPENTPSWDSFNALVIVTELEDAFKVSFSIEEIEGVSCFLDIKDCLIKHNILF